MAGKMTLEELVKSTFKAVTVILHDGTKLAGNITGHREEEEKVKVLFLLTSENKFISLEVSTIKTVRIMKSNKE